MYKIITFEKKVLFREITQKIWKNSAKHPFISESSVKNLENVKHELYKRTLKSVVRSFKLTVGDKKSRRQNRFRKINKKIARMDLLIYKNIKLSMNFIFVDKHFFGFLASSFSDFFFAQQNLWKFSALKKCDRKILIYCIYSKSFWY